MAITELKNKIKQRVEEQLNWDDRVPESDIKIEVTDGVVRLSGEVPTYSSRLAAEEDALSVGGVYLVENDLNIKYPESFQVPNDNEIKSLLKNSLINDHRIHENEIKVNVFKGTVELDGIVSAFWQKDIIEKYAYHLPGVKDVVNNLKVKLTREFSDVEITADIKNAFMRNAIINSEQINVSVNNGIATLSGIAPNYSVKITARDLAYFTAGIKNVTDNIVVK